MSFEMIKSNQNRASPAFSRHLPPVHSSGVRYPTKASLEMCIDFNRVLFASSAPDARCLTHLFSHLSLFFLKRVLLARCLSHYSGSGCRPSMIALHTLCLSPSRTHRPLSMTHTQTHTRTVYLNELGDNSSVSQQINHQTNWHICHKRGCLQMSRWALQVLYEFQAWWISTKH